MTTTAPFPLVLLPACNHDIDGHPSCSVRRRYLEAVAVVGCQGLIVQEPLGNDIDAILDLFDGVLLTGSPSNVEPRHFGEEVDDPSLPLDPQRDGWTLPLIRRALQRGIPIFGICRGFQEMHVVLGGGLLQTVHEVPGLMDHRPVEGQGLDRRYAAAHAATIQPGGLLDELIGAGEIQVNSLHGQGVGTLAEGLRTEALAPDGVVESFTSASARGFNLAVQWHPEWAVETNPVSMKIFEAFAAACRVYRDRRLAGS